MKCADCGGLVLWMGPMTNLTHTECQQCRGINCQEAEPSDKCYCVDCLNELDGEPEDGLCDTCRTRIKNGGKPIEQGGRTMREILQGMYKKD